MTTITESFPPFIDWAQMNPQELEALIENKIDEKLRPIEDKLGEIHLLLAKFEGAGTLVKVLVLGVAPLIGVITYLRDHWKL